MRRGITSQFLHTILCSVSRKQNLNFETSWTITTTPDNYYYSHLRYNFLDSIEGLPMSQGIDTILVVVDHCKKYGRFIGKKHPLNAQSTVEVFVQEMLRLHAFHFSVVPDRYRTFLSLFRQETFKLQGTHLNHGTALRVRGPTEVLNKTLDRYLWQSSMDNQIMGALVSVADYSCIRLNTPLHFMPLIKAIVTQQR